MVKVRIIGSRRIGAQVNGASTILAPGATVELTEFWAERLIANGAAVAVDAPKPKATKPAAEKSAAKKPAKKK